MNHLVLRDKQARGIYFWALPIVVMACVGIIALNGAL